MKKEKKFKAKKGQTDFTNIRWAPVLHSVLQYRGKILLLQRAAGMRLHPGLWHGVAGFLDDGKSLREKIEEELSEELGLKKSAILSIKLGRIYDQEAPEYNKIFVVHPVLVKLNTNKIKLNWESQDAKWFSLAEVRKMKAMPGFNLVLAALFG